MSNHQQPAFNLSQNPIQDMQFKGLHWIEASAGSGKTYTLSSLMVRILMDDYLPKQVIATTFTRAAAAELKSRIRLRLQESYRFLNGKRDLTESQNLAQAATASDPLLAQLQRDFANSMGYACERLKLVLQQLDELFVGTLDSFSQKLLREFAFESGRTEAFEISDEPKLYSLELIHDSLRQWIQQQPQLLIDWLNSARLIQSPEYYLEVVEKALNFSAAHWPEPREYADAFQAQLNQLRKVDVSAIASISERLPLTTQFIPYASGSIFRNQSFAKLFEQLLPEWLSLLTLDLSDQQQLLTVCQFYLKHQKHWDALLKNALNQKIFTKKLAAAAQLQFYDDVGIQALVQLILSCQQIQQALTAVAGQLQRHLCQRVAQRLPELLQQHQQTTFAVQIQSLAHALQGKQGQRFAQAVHRRYPLILVDEFQDTNFEQDQMLRSIWRQPSRLESGCMIMVGDRKQAIYGFRGGDMLTFIQAHAEVQQLQGRFYELAFNHRSVAPLVQAVDGLMQAQPDFGEQVLYRPVKAGARAHPALHDPQGANHAPLVWFEIDKAEEAEQVAWQILALLAQSAQGQLYFSDAQQQHALQADDFAVLATSHRQLDAVQQALQKLNIMVHRPAKRSVFDSVMAQDVAAILLALQHPYHEARLKRALLTRMLGFNLQQLQALSASAEGLSAIMAQFDALQKHWREHGFMSAWQKLLSQFQVWQNVVATAAEDNERCVVNLRHLTELLNQHSQQHSGIHRLMAWYMLQLHRPAQRDWELERKLSKAAGVQLLTIHQSKGLEFKIVFLLGSNKPAQNRPEPITLSTTEQSDPQQQQTRLQRMIQVSADPSVEDAAKQAHVDRREAELHRLWYVAITRASHRVYAMWHREAPTDVGLGFWRNEQRNPDHLSRVQPALAQAPQPVFAAQSANATSMTTTPTTTITTIAWPERRFYVQHKTSFTSLAPQHQAFQRSSSDRLAVQFAQHHPSDDELTNLLEPSAEAVLLAPITAHESTQTAMDVAAANLELSWVAQAFPKGAQAGNFLHELFEVIDFQDSSAWSEHLRRRFDNQYPVIKTQLWQRYVQDFSVDSAELSHSQHAGIHAAIDPLMQAWLQQILNTPLHDDFRLSQLPRHARVAEFNFDVSVSAQPFQSQRLQHILNQHLQAQFGLSISELREAYTAHYLTGSIDLLYWHNSRIYIADYKSNFLGRHYADYTTAAIQHSMTEACYWLQAALYLLAVHRYFSLHWSGYQIEQHLGGASYLYLRGMQGQADSGVLYWAASPALILALDAALKGGQHVA